MPIRRKGQKTFVLGGKIRKARLQKNFSQAEVARLVGVSHAMLSHWEGGNCVPTEPHKESLSRVLGIGL